MVKDPRRPRQYSLCSQSEPGSPGFPSVPWGEGAGEFRGNVKGGYGGLTTAWGIASATHRGIVNSAVLIPAKAIATENGTVSDRLILNGSDFMIRVGSDGYVIVHITVVKKTPRTTRKRRNPWGLSLWVWQWLGTGKPRSLT